MDPQVSASRSPGATWGVQRVQKGATSSISGRDLGTSSCFRTRDSLMTGVGGSPSALDDLEINTFSITALLWHV